MPGCVPPSTPKPFSPPPPRCSPALAAHSETPSPHALRSGPLDSFAHKIQPTNLSLRCLLRRNCAPIGEDRQCTGGKTMNKHRSIAKLLMRRRIRLEIICFAQLTNLALH